MTTDQDTPIITPIVHLGGNSYHSLMTDLRRVHSAMTIALNALAEISPNQRNFYVEPGRFEKAKQQHQQRVDALRTVMLSLEREALQLCNDTQESVKRR